MFYDVDHPNVSLSEWQTFLKEPPPHLIGEVIDRSKLGLPWWFVPFARGIAIASNALLREAGHRLGMHRPRGWLNYNVDMFRWMIDWDPFNRRWLLVRQCNNQGLWTIERWRKKRTHGNADELLVINSDRRQFLPVTIRRPRGSLCTVTRTDRQLDYAGYLRAPKIFRS
jgi:hypothetical protein